MTMTKFNKLMLAAGLGAVVVTSGLTGCSSMIPRNTSDGRTTGQALDDRRLASDVKKSLAKDPLYKFDAVDVKTFNGVVQLVGFANSEEQKRRAGEITQQIPGVARVENDIALKPTTTPTGRSEGNQGQPNQK